MASSTLRRRKKALQDRRWRAMTPAQRLQRAAEMTTAATALRAAGLAQLGFSLTEIDRIEHSRNR